MVEVHPRTLRIYEDEGLVCPARTPTNIRLYSENDIRRVLWIRHLTQDRGVNLAGVRILFELEERLGTRILEVLFDEGRAQAEVDPATDEHSYDGRAAEPEPEAPAEATRGTDYPGPTSSSRPRITARIVTTRITSRPTGDPHA